MEEERMRWITRPPTLDRWEVKVTYSETPAGRIGHVYAAGFCSRKRGPIWTHTEALAVTGTGYGLGDLLTHLALVVEQDRPNTQARLERSMIGVAWDQPELPF